MLEARRRAEVVADRAQLHQAEHGGVRAVHRGGVGNLEDRDVAAAGEDEGLLLAVRLELALLARQRVLARRAEFVNEFAALGLDGLAQPEELLR